MVFARPFLAVCALALGCAQSPYDRAWLGRALVARTGFATRDEAHARPDDAPLPPGVSRAALTDDAAVATALWNNAAFNAELSQLGFARADLAEAGMLPNPTLALLLPLGPRQIESWLAWPIEALWQRPRRVEAAQRDVARVAQTLVQTGLDLARDVRLAHADAVLARGRATLRAEAAQVMTSLAELAQARLRRGDIGAPEAAAAALDAGTAQELSLRARAEVTLADARLRLLLGLTDRGAFTPVADPPPLDAAEGLDGLLEVAMSARPDVRAAELGMEAAGARLGWERTRIFGLVARVDGFGPAPLGPAEVTARVGVQATLPLFHQNQFGIGRAEAEVERAAWRYAQVRQQVVAEVTSAQAQAEQLASSLRAWREAVRPAAEEAARGAERSLAQGESSWIAVLDATRRVVEVRLREVELEAELRRARALLQRSTGGRRASR
ncbi:MAG: TolC family protein [Polyangiales bacterium]